MKVGQKVYLKLITRTLNHREKNFKPEDRIIETKITKVGRKYIYVDVGNPSWTFYIDDLLEATCFRKNWKLYFNKQDILDEFEAEEIIRKIRGAIEWGQCELSIGQLRWIEKIIDEEE